MSLRLLFDHNAAYVPIDAISADIDRAPEMVTIYPALDRLKAFHERLLSTSINDLIGLCDAIAKAWSNSLKFASISLIPEIGFLPLWMRKNNLMDFCSLSLRGEVASLDTFVSLGNDQQMYRAHPRGTVVHWFSGNTPVVGMLGLLQSFLCKNLNIVKVSHANAGIIPALLEAFASVEYINPDGKRIPGTLLSNTVLVVYTDHEEKNASTLSLAADVRIVWGGREAVKSIVNLPHQYGVQDIIFGHKTSFVIVGAEYLFEESARSIANAIAQDTIAFDQRGCNSPHTIFVEEGGAISPETFAGYLAHALQNATLSRPLRHVEPKDCMDVLTVRARYAMEGTAYFSSDIRWAVVYNAEDVGIATPCYNRTLFVRPIQDVFDVVPFCSSYTQTAGLAVTTRRLILANALTAHGVERCPQVGSMRMYETPWDGMFLMDRLVRWVSVAHPHIVWKEL